MTWTGDAAESKARIAFKGDDSRHSSSVEPEKPTRKRARKNGIKKKKKPGRNYKRHPEIPSKRQS
jgi:hypothetical protein